MTLGHRDEALGQVWHVPNDGVLIGLNFLSLLDRNLAQELRLKWCRAGGDGQVDDQ